MLAARVDSDCCQLFAIMGLWRPRSPRQSLRRDPLDRRPMARRPRAQTRPMRHHFYSGHSNLVSS